MTSPLSLSTPPRQIIRILGMPIDTLTESQTIARIIDALSHHHGGWVITPNLDQLRLFHRQPTLRDMYAQADLVVADGMPLVWASRILGHSLPQRVAGSNLIYPLSQAAAQHNRSIFLLGGNPGSAQAAAQKLTALYPNLKIAGILCPPLGFEFDPNQMAIIQQSLQQSQPDIVYVGLGFPKQERLIATLRPQLPHTWFLGIGVTFSFVAGQIPRAPKWMQNTGTEWLHRLLHEPRRLTYRYLVQDIPFALALLARSLLTRLKTGTPPTAPESQISNSQSASAKSV